MSTRIIIILSILLLSIKAKAGNPLIDSLRSSFYSTSEYSVKKNSLIKLCENYRMLPVDTFKSYAHLFARIATTSNVREDELLSKFYKANWHLRVGELDSFYYYYKLTEKEVSPYPALQLRYIIHCGQYFVKKNKHEEAFTKYYAALKLAEEIKDTLFIVHSKSGIGWTHMEMSQIEEAINWFKKAIQTTPTSKFQLNFPTIYTNLASCYGAMGKFDSSKYFCNQALELSINNHDLSAQANANFILGNLFMVDKKYKEAEDVFLEGYRIHKLIGDPFFIVSDMAQLSIHFSNTKQFDKGIEMAKLAIQYARLHNLDAKLFMCYDALSLNYKGAKQFELYGEALKIMNDLKDSTYGKTSEIAVAEMNAKYETEKKEKLIQKQKFEITKRNYFLFGGGCIFILLGMLGYVMYRNRSHQQEKRLQDELIKQQDIASKAVIEAEENERRRIAADLHDGIGQMLTAVKMNLEGLTDRISIVHSEDKLIYEKVKGMLEESCKEVRNVSHNIMPNALIKSGLGNAVKDFIDKVNNEKLDIQLSTTGINEKLASNIEIVVYRVIQECVNNVIKHSKANQLDISIIKDADGLNVTIEDNGKGFNMSSLEHAKGIGMKNIRTRIEYLRGSVDIDSKPGRGTLIAFYIPI